MPFYDDMQNVASEILEEFKQGVIKYIEVTPGAGTVDDPGASTETEYTLNGTANGVKFKYVQNGLAIASDMQVVTAVRFDIIPDMKGFIEIDNIRYKIVQILPKPAAGTTVANVFIVRR